ncbi:pyrethroid hydrolase Ces2e-like isoform X3 [Hyperolius riggenbachi]|uniref:pyrethroid hydrolase Ces2e-like isoform X3 n=1 Tax=Hyperolius riggenbachi TaxID=752182 RepID=UPI0035A2A0AD
MEAAGRCAVLCCLVLLLAGLSAGEEDGRPLVSTPYGKLRGKTVTVKGTDRRVHSFYAIPFAKPPVGPLRFAATGPPEPWESVREATEQPPMCLQSIQAMELLIHLVNAKIAIPPTSEDCLYLNVFTPADRGQDAKLPVMVFIHGGGLSMGGAMMFQGSALSAHENVVTVSIQYRLGIPGFYSTGDSRAPGNYGFLDQVEALHWVQKNIKAFGGDPNLVTIFGHSAGGLSVSALVLSPLTKGLVHRAIAEAGVALMPGLVATSSQELVFIQKVIANVSGCDEATLLDCLKGKSEEELRTLIGVLAFVTPPAAIDGVFFPKPAEQILADKENNPVPFMTGIAEQEYGWILPMAMNISGMREGMDRETFPTLLENIPFLGMFRGLIPLLVEEYIGEESDPAKVRNGFVELCGDFIFVMPALKTAKYHRGESNEEEAVLSKAVMKYWANFARTGDPNSPGLVHWPQYDKDEDYLQIDIHPRAAQILKGRKYEFWTKTIPEKMQKLSEEAQERSEL